MPIFIVLVPWPYDAFLDNDETPFNALQRPSTRFSKPRQLQNAVAVPAEPRGKKKRHDIAPSPIFTEVYSWENPQKN